MFPYALAPLVCYNWLLYNTVFFCPDCLSKPVWFYVFLVWADEWYFVFFPFLLWFFRQAVHPVAVGDLVQCFCNHSVWVFSFSEFLGEELACFFVRFFI